MGFSPKISGKELKMELKSIGKINTPYKTMEDVPFHDGAADKICELEISKEYQDGLKDISQATHLIVLYWLDKADRNVLQEDNPHDKKVHGIFATRTPNRPNPIGISITGLVERKDNILRVRGITALDGTDIIDVKPYFTGTDCVPEAKIDWFETSTMS